MLGALSLNKGARAPQIAGLEKPISQPAIIIFFDSDCDHCRDEIDWTIEHYKEITGKGYRVVSIASDIHENNYKMLAATFPWAQADRLCDFKGMAGENFKNYGIIGTPTIFAIDKNGVIVGKYAKVSEIEIIKDK
jgi:protein-disulfide isomerase